MTPITRARTTPSVIVDVPAAGAASLHERHQRLRRPTRVMLLESDTFPIALDALSGEVKVVASLSIPVAAQRLSSALDTHKPRHLLCTPTLDQLDPSLFAVCRLHRVQVLVLARPSYGVFRPMRLRRIGGLPWLRVGRGKLWPGDERLKRCFDLSLTLLSLPVTLPLMAMIAIATCTSGSPLYVQDRVGSGGRTFRMIKFRTMVANAECELGPRLACIGDLRVTRVGRVLRRLRLDELPQLWNVLRGDMSLVGPRPERPQFIVELRLLPDYELRELMRPGLSGIAQLTCGYYATAEDKLRCDLLYLHSRSLRTDVMLLGLTVVALCRGFPRG